MKKLFSILLILLSVHASAQCLLKEVPLGQRTAAAELIIEGAVVGSQSFWNNDRTMIYTSHTIEVYKVFKGVITAGSVEVLTEGGTVDDRMIRVEPSLSLKKNETGIFILEAAKRFKGLPASATGRLRYEVYGSLQGFLKYDLYEKTATDPFKKYSNIEEVLYRTLSPSMNFTIAKPFNVGASTTGSVASRTMAITDFSPATLSAGTGAVLTINGSGFGAVQGSGVVRFRSADNGGAGTITPLPTQYVAWSDNQIRVQVPAEAGTGTVQVVQGVTYTTATSLTISYAHINIDFNPGSGTLAYQTDHINDDGAGGYTWRMNTAFDANADAKASYLRAFNTWTCGTSVNWTIGSTTAVADALSDGINVVTFDNTAPLSAGTLGVCYSYWSGCASGPNIVWYVNELDIIFDEGSNISPRTWEFGTAAPSTSEYDFETVAVHELGHGHQLGHVVSPGAIMHYAIANGTANRSLSANDLAGGSFVQAKSTVANICGPGAMTASVGCTTLPIYLTSVTANRKGPGIELTFTNAAETDVLRYEVEESDNGVSFKPAATLLPTANNSRRADYRWFDNQVQKGPNFYRVKSVAQGGKIKYTTVVVANMTGEAEMFTVYPNPVKGTAVTVAFNNLQQGTYTLAMFNASGQQVVIKTLVHSGGYATENIVLPSVAPGVYCFSIRGNNKSLQQTVVIDNR